MVGAADEQQSAKTAYRAGENHCADDDLVYLDADIAGGSLAFTDNGDLIAMLGVVQIEIHQNRDERDNEDIQKVFIASDLRKPADLGGLVDDADLAGALGIFPNDNEIGYELHGDIVHHQSKERFVRIVFRFEIRRDKAPESAGENAAHAHAHNHKCVRQCVTQADHTRRRSQRAGEHLTLAADIPEAHFKGRRHGERNAKQHGDVLQQHPNLAGRAERAVKNGRIYLQRVFTGHRGCDNGANNKRKKNRRRADAPGFIPGKNIPLRDMNERRFHFLIHGFVLPALSSSCRLRAFPRRGRGRYR